MNQIIVIEERSSKVFTKKVNDLLSKDWKLHGTPVIQSVPQQDTWAGGDLRCWATTTYNQVLVKDSVQ